MASWLRLRFQPSPEAPAPTITEDPRRNNDACPTVSDQPVSGLSQAMSVLHRRAEPHPWPLSVNGEGKRGRGLRGEVSRRAPHLPVHFESSPNGSTVQQSLDH